MAIQDTVNAFCPDGLFTVEGAADGPLKGLAFAAKDVFDTAGHVTGAGNPDWRDSHQVATENAPAVQVLLDAGARLVGKTITDELTFSMIGENFHYGMPENTAAPGRIPGGSSSGSASAVAAGLVDFALGTDTAGSVRIPASFCGLHGLRPTHGRVSPRAVVPLAPSFDAVGWLARQSDVMSRVGKVILGSGEAARPDRLLILGDAFAALEPHARAAFKALTEEVSNYFPRTGVLNLGDDGKSPGSLADWVRAFRTQQGFEVWKTHGEWIRRTRPTFGPAVSERFKWASGIDPAAAAAAARKCARIRDYVDHLLADGSVLCLPSAPGAPPRSGQSQASYDRMRVTALQIVCPSSLAGTPQISIPLGRIDGCPLGLGLMARRGADFMLLDLAETITQTIDKPV